MGLLWRNLKVVWRGVGGGSEGGVQGIGKYVKYKNDRFDLRGWLTGSGEPFCHMW